ncbi:MAG: hypothetical protein COB36_11950 [Alphaproteobacteria bacterium]|nr:MAG: hypothetical protein COB36_11950 [Alphaproteobacteria bacterium]
MKILLEQVFNSGDRDEKRITLIDHTIDCEQDAIAAYDAINGFDSMIEASAYFNDNDYISLELNGESLGYEQVESWRQLVEMLGGTL